MTLYLESILNRVKNTLVMELLWNLYLNYLNEMFEIEF